LKFLVISILAALTISPAIDASESDSLEKLLARTPVYDLTVLLKPDSHQMELTGTVILPPSDKPRSVIELNLSELMKQFHAEIIEPAESAGTPEIVKGAKQDSTEHFVRWQLHPKRAIAANKPVKLRFSYNGGEGTGFVFYIGPEGSFAGGSNAAWYPQWDENSGTGIGLLKFSIPPDYKVLATGKSLGTASEEAQGNFVFKNDVPSQFSFAAGKYTVLRRDGVVPMRAYLLHPRKNIDDYLVGSSKVLAVLSKEFGPYPYGEFAIAEVPTQQALKAGFSGASFNGFMLSNEEFLDQPFNLAYYGHEIGHQWWGNAVLHAEEPRGDYMLDEAMAQFGSLRVVEAVDGPAAAEEYRRTGYPDYSPTQCGYGYLRSVKAGRDHALGNLPDDPNSHELADSKGFLVWDLLARTVGPERFSQALHDVTQKYRFRSIRWEEFLAAIQSVSKEDLSWFFSQWLERKGAPDWQITWKQEGGQVRGEITQAAPFYRAQVQVEIVGPDGQNSEHTLDVNDAKTAFDWPASFHVQSVVVDPHYYVLHWVPNDVFALKREN